MEFFDMKTKKKFSTDKYRVEKRKVRGKMRNFAVAKTPSGGEAWRIM